MSTRSIWFGAPEEAALEGWRSTPTANAYVLSVTVIGDRAQVVVATVSDPEGDHDWVYCVKRDRGWREVVSGSGPSSGWDHPADAMWDEFD